MNRRTISREHWRSVFHNIPRLLFDMRQSRSLRELYGFLYFNSPYRLPRARFPVRVTVEPTNRCNFRCTHCHRYSANADRPPGEMDFDLYCRIVAELSEHPGTLLKIGGWGEPSLHARFSEMMSRSLEAGVRTVVYTNGTIFDRLTTAETLALRQTTFVLSVDGYDAEQYGAIRIGGDYARLRDNIAQLFEHRNVQKQRFPVIVVQHVVFPHDTSRQLERFRHSWTAISDMVDYCVYNPLVPAGADVQHDFFRRCKRVRRELSILYDGAVPVCGPQSKYGEHEEIGNVAHASIADIWNGPALTKVRASHHKRDLESMPFCQSCIYFR
jgi:MoaA/NifB/PqqE/SkfB family radical SAM enzyme